MLILPLVLDIAIGLVFIYISLSLIASEIQEIISTLLEFRAKHLKTSIQYLLMGSDIDSVNEIQQTKQLIDELYDNPLIKNLNHQGQGTVSYWLKQRNPWRVDTPNKLKDKLLKRLNQVKDIDLTDFKNEMEEILNNKKIQENSLDVIRLNFKQKFNQLLLKQSNQTNRQKLVKIRTELLENKTLPSYIPSETFATTLLESLQIPQLTHYYSSDKFKGVIKRLIKKLSELDNLDPGNLEKFIKEIKEIYDDFSDQKYKLEVSLLRVKARLNELILDNDNDETTRQNLESIKNTFFEGKNFEILCHELKLNLIYIAQFLELDGSEIKRGEFEKTNHNKQKKNNEEEWENTVIFNKFTEQFNNEEEKKKNEQVQKQIKYVVEKLPKSLQNSMITLAHRAQTRVKTSEQDIEQLSQEVETWFNNSMERASGVYKRNAKGLALVIGFFIALFANADTFHMISRLSTDGILREAIVNSAVELQKNCDDDNSLSCVKNTTEQNLDNLSLPIGWSCTNFQQQTSLDYIPLFGLRVCDSRENNSPPEKTEKRFNYPLVGIKIVKVLLGLIISAVAISMGSSFWFDILNKLVNVRNTGSKPTAESQLTEKSAKGS